MRKLPEVPPGPFYIKRLHFEIISAMPVFYQIVSQKLRGALHLLAPHIESHFNPELPADIILRNIVRVPVAAVGENMRANLAELFTNTDIIRIFLVAGQDHFIHFHNRLDDFLSLLVGHEFNALFLADPMIIIEHYHQPAPQLLRVLKEPNVPDVQGIKSPAYHYYFGFSRLWSGFFILLHYPNMLSK